jgi:hypothetical protein
VSFAPASGNRTGDTTAPPRSSARPRRALAACEVVKRSGAKPLPCAPAPIARDRDRHEGRAEGGGAGLGDAAPGGIGQHRQRRDVGGSCPDPAPCPASCSASCARPSGSSPARPAWRTSFVTSFCEIEPGAALARHRPRAGDAHRVVVGLGQGRFGAAGPAPPAPPPPPPPRSGSPPSTSRRCRRPPGSARHRARRGTEGLRDPRARPGAPPCGRSDAPMGSSRPTPPGNRWRCLGLAAAGATVIWSAPAPLVSITSPPGDQAVVALAGPGAAVDHARHMHARLLQVDARCDARRHCWRRRHRCAPARRHSG